MPDPNLTLPLLLFLSHAGVDTEAARKVKQRLEAAPEAREHGLRIWLDKDDLCAGESWQTQLEKVIRHRSTAFAVYVGSGGIVNWVDAEVQLALGRAIIDPSYRFIPILSPQAPGPEALPGFVALYQGVADVEGQPDQFAKLVAAILGRNAAGTAKLEAEPFFGLKAIDEDRAHLFFGREQETETLLRLLGREPLVMVTGDSGSGKSSLARAGLVPRWRGGALTEAIGERPSDTIWHVVQNQPRTRPFQTLAEAVSEAAKRLGLSLDKRGTLENWVRSGDPDQVRRALWCDLPPARTRVLLLVDQFEELVTSAELLGEREAFVRLLLALADPKDPRARVVLTMRRDYYNLVSDAFPELYRRLEADDHRARLILGRIPLDGLHRVVTEPLRLAGVPEGDREALADQIAGKRPKDNKAPANDTRGDMGDRPGDLALVQMALTETWDRRHAFGDDLLRAYADVGRVEGAIARAAEDVYAYSLDDAERALAEPVFVRLVRLGDTGGATRRSATRIEFDDANWQLVQKLASKEAKRLVLVGGGEAGETAEIAHEALVTQWPRYQSWLSGRDPDGSDRAADKRVLDALTQRAVAWAAAPNARAKAKHLATGAELDAFVSLAGRRPAWLSADEHKLVSDSHDAATRQQRRERWLFRGVVGAALVAIVAAGGALHQRDHAETARQQAEQALADVRANLIWNTLELSDKSFELQPHELDALWELATKPITRTAFLQQLSDNPSFVVRFARLSDPIIRTFGLRLTAVQTHVMLGAVLDAIGNTDVKALPSLLAAIQALTSQLTAEQEKTALADRAQAALGRVLDAIIKHDTQSQMADAVPILASQLSAAQKAALSDQMQTALAHLIDKIRTDVGPDGFSNFPALTRVGSYSRAAQAISSQLTPEQANATVGDQPQAALRHVIDLMTEDRHGQLETNLPLVVLTLQSLPVQLNLEQAQSALGRLLNFFEHFEHKDLLSENISIELFGQVAEAIISKTAPEEAKAKVRHQAQAAIGSRILLAMQSTTDAGELYLLVSNAERLPLTAEQAESALGRVIDLSSQTEDADLVRLLTRLADQLTAEKAQPMLSRVLDVVRNTDDPENLGSLLFAVQRFPVRLTSEQADLVLSRVLNALENTVAGRHTGTLWTGQSDTYVRLSLAVNAITSKLVSDRAPPAVGRVLEKIRHTYQLDALPLLASEVEEELVSQLTVDQTLIYPDTMQALARAIQKLAAEVAAENERKLRRVVNGMMETTDPDALNNLVKDLSSFAGLLTQDQARTALHAILLVTFSRESSIFDVMVSRGGLGVRSESVSKEMAERLGLPEVSGAFIENVITGSPADLAGIKAGDVILGFDGKTIHGPSSLEDQIARERPGNRAVVVLWRGDKRKTITVVFSKEIDLDTWMKFYHAMLITLVDTIQMLPVQLTAEQAQSAREGITRAMRRSSGNDYAHSVLAQIVVALAPKLNDADRADMLTVSRSGLGLALSGLAAVDWARAYEALLPPSPLSDYIGAIVEVIRYPTTAIKNISPRSGLRSGLEEKYMTSATRYLQKRISDRFPDAQELQSGNFTDLVDWIAKNYSKIELEHPPVRPDYSEGSGFRS